MEDLLETIDNMEYLLKQIRITIEEGHTVADDFKKNIEDAYRALSFAAPYES